MLLLPGGGVYVLPSRLNRARSTGQEPGLAGGVGGCGAAGLEETGRVAPRGRDVRAFPGTPRLRGADLSDSGGQGALFPWSFSFLTGNHRTDCTASGGTVVRGLKFPLGTAG